jgi:N-sulfoglucosamine sulfohydrolase
VLEDAGKLDNTVFVMTGDNGWPFPRAKANVYDAGTHVPLAVRWPARGKAGRTSDALISLTDLAPTFLEAAGLKPLPEMAAKSFLPIVVGDDAVAKQNATAEHSIVFTERERHANVRAGDLSYPSRAIRTDKLLYIRNLRPDLWPAGDPHMWKAVGPFGDIDGGPTKQLLLQRRLDEGFANLFKLACEKRPEEELFDLSKDPNCLRNVAGYSEYRQEQLKLRAGLDHWMSSTGDPRSTGGGAYDAFDRYQYYGPPSERPTTRGRGR